MKKITFKGVALGLVLGIILGMVISAFIAGAFMGFFISIPKPEIKEGEFDFALTYVVDGEEKKIEGTYVCKYEGTSRNIDGISRDWKGYIKNHDDFTEYEIKTIDEGVIMVSLDIRPEFFMSDPDYIDSYDIKPEPYLYITSGDQSIEDPTNEIFFDYYTGDDVKIISFEYDEPIENEYK